MNQLYLFATLAGTRIAVETREVEAVVKLTDISPVPGMGAHVAGLSALRSRVLTVIDVAALVRGRPTPMERRVFAIIADISGHSYGLMVDAVHDICQVPEGELPLRGQLDAAWAPYARGLVEHEGQPYLLVSLSGFIEAGTVAQAA
ncbi:MULTISPECIES: chemotaxis protein CheW [Sphingobium]|jgi:purine-binding chemotaxis protein CheW|uniref:Chemotaxis protein CheW n=2 Tax=Sphingobium fuliginis (strain ATCC 27551) TaxID=336203 RepID=A0A292ZCX1_SPHSA|nr:MULTISPECIES: chemotaxis protein CheW [Sphingobium]OAP32575.1 chemotaxis protein [Sphingobium sp. 20006FA]AJR26028.1 chemotaxis protein [Sphingobium sp. YBL2]KXU29726.1 chemotaxis protein [Sphingobium sp. AM]KYC33391.1 chemotaxis protein [Sphingobium sp. 22B]MCB4860875.1 chemotaxis protein CheW [Sphingobium sp. PNB]